MVNKCDGINEKSPQEAAYIVGKVEKSNYLAHTIREIELGICLKYGENYRINTYEATTRRKTAKITFHDRCCVIKLPSELDGIDDRHVRLILAHELGHLIYNFGKLNNPEVLHNSKTSVEEEAFAWAFAYCLINKKSDDHRSDIRRSRFVYGAGELRRSLESILEEQRPEIRDAALKLLFGNLNVERGIAGEKSEVA